MTVTFRSFARRRWAALLGGLFAALLLVGCGAPPAQFTQNRLYAHKSVRGSVPEGKTVETFELSAQQRQDVSEVLEALFGTPDQPKLPPLATDGLKSLFDLTKIQASAGRVSSDEQGRAVGLYREHCAHCHGVTGDGMGPTASFLNPYPRDYRRGTFKFKSTEPNAKPTHADLKLVLLNGIAGTSMPSFKLLPENEVESLIHYVRYLAVRGEVERKIYDLYATGDLDVAGRLVDPENLDTLQPLLLGEDAVVPSVLASWEAAEGKVVPVPGRPEMTTAELAASRERGRSLFLGAAANCASCHGIAALGDGQTNIYDNWTTDFIENDGKPKLISEYVALGMLEPRKIKPRNLRQGVYRGGRRPVDIFWRIRNGIEGTPMPAAKALTDEQVWDLVNYVQSMPFESLSDPRQHEPGNTRERM